MTRGLQSLNSRSYSLNLLTMVKRITTLFIFAILLWGCKEEVDFPLPKDFPVVKTLEPVVINEDDVNLVGELVLPANLTNNIGEIEFGFIANSRYFKDTIFVGKTNESRHFSYILSKRYYRETTITIHAFAKYDSIFYQGAQKTAEVKGKYFTINNLIPRTGVWQDTLTITGSRLDGAPEKTRIYFRSGNYERFAHVSAIDSNFIEFIVPPLMPSNTHHIVLKIDVLTVYMYDVFKFDEPKITDFYPKSGFQGDTVTINGNYFGHYHETATIPFSVTFGEYQLPIVSWNNQEIKAIMDVSESQENHFKVKHLHYHDTSQNTYNLINPRK